MKTGTALPPTLTLPPDAVANPAFAHEARLDEARRFLAERGITAVRPIYRARPVKSVAATAPQSAREAAHARWFDSRCA